MSNESAVLEEMQKVELQILSYFHSICEENHLKYVLGYGSCIGAIRHNGFIPWDDDIDVLVPADDYRKLLELLSDNSSTYKLKCIDTDNKYLYSYAKLTDPRTNLSESFDKNNNLGIYIDIFPVYGLPNNRILRNIKVYYILLIESLCVSARQPNAINKGRVRTIVQRFLSIVGKGIGLRKLNEYIIKLSSNGHSSSSSFYSVLPPNYGKKEIIEYDLFEQCVKHKFENISVYISSQYDEYLTQLYGDYMTPPPQNERLTHHLNEIN